jgi:hypothetical protein
MRLHNWKVSLILRTARILRRPVIVNGDDAIVIFWRSPSQREGVISSRLDSTDDNREIISVDQMASVPLLVESSVRKNRKAPTPRPT